MAVGLQRSGDWLAAWRSDQCAAPPANHRCAVGLLTAIAAREFRLLKLILHLELRRRAASCRALPCTSSFVCGPKFITSPEKFGEDIPTGMEVIQGQTLNFKPNVKFLRLNFFGGPPSHLGSALGSLGQSLERV